MKVNRRVDVSLVVTLIIVLAAGIVLLGAFERRTEAAAAGHLKTMLMLRASVLSSYFESLRSEVALWSGQPIVRSIMQRLLSARNRGDHQALSDFGSQRTGNIESAAAGREDVAVDDRIREFAAYHGYYDVFFISADGDVLYTVAKEDDYRTNLVDGPFAKTGLGRLYRTLVASTGDAMAMEDFSRYLPSHDEPAAFLGARVTDESGRLLGIYAVQIPEQPINEIMQFSAGMGETGETYLVGQDGLMRSTSRFFEASTVLESEVTGTSVRKALEGEVGVEIVDDYRGIPVYSAYRPFDFEGIHWAVLAEQDVAEVRLPVDRAWRWLLGGFALLSAVALLLRFMLIRMVVPTAVAALLGLSLVHLDDHD